MRPVRRTRSIAFAALACLLGMGLLAAACGDDSDDGAKGDGGGGAAKPAVVVADQGFGESKILAQIYGQLLADHGYQVSYQSLKDRSATYTAFANGDIDLEPDYAASALEFLNGNAGEASGDITATADKLQTRLAEKGLVALDPSKAVDTNSLVVTKQTAESKNLTKISDLTPDMKLGGPQDCPTNAGCIPALQKTYGIDLSKNFVPLDTGGPNTKSALEQGDIDVAVLFSTDSTIAAKGWKVLEDDKGIFNADNVIPVVTKQLAKDQQLVDLVDQASSKLSTDELTQLNKRFDVDKEDADVIAKDFLKEKGLL
jgi:osmoprotectant transport system substrate-binding protein